jgi:hypothetical protein
MCNVKILQERRLKKGPFFFCQGLKANWFAYWNDFITNVVFQHVDHVFFVGTQGMCELMANLHQSFNFCDQIL